MIKKLRKKIKKYLYINYNKEEQLGISGEIDLFAQKFYYHHKAAFQDTYKEVFEKEIYKFNPRNESSVIIDCGANMGLSLLYFSKNYPKAKIYAFEPDKIVIPFLEKNIVSYNMDNVVLFKKAVWIREEVLEFYTDEGMGGSLVNDYNHNQTPTHIETTRLKDFISDKHIDFLKLDIEGSEYLVMKDCEEVLKQIDFIFVEYHSFDSDEQKLDDLLSLFKRNGFRYHLSQSFSRNRPFVDKSLVCEKIDMAINVYAYK